jgi:UDP-hydrolysing UDP-N-acetyl-D-glucosamine 2-epimerase
VKKICVVLGSRANYGSIKKVMQLIEEDSELSLQVVLMGSTMAKKFGNIQEQVIRDGFRIDYKIDALLESTLPSSMAKTTGITLIEMATCLEHLDPSIVLTVGDRYETMATAIAASYSNRVLAHTMGGEITGTLDESVRHAITKLSHLHFVSTKNAKRNVIQLGEKENDVHLTGCPRLDFVRETLAEASTTAKMTLGNVNELGVGQEIDTKEPFALIAVHPVTSEWQEADIQIVTALESIKEIGLQAIVIWPNADAGNNLLSKGIRVWRERNLDSPFRFINDLKPQDFFILMNTCAVMVGNSSAGIREGSFIGTPYVNVGSRQSHREMSANTICVPWNKQLIKDGVSSHLKHGRYVSSDLYGDGFASSRIVSVLKEPNPSIQKIFTARENVGLS